MRAPTSVPSLLLFVSAALLSQATSAHISLLEPTRRYSDQKNAACGRGGALDVRTSNVNVFEPGQTITVRWREDIDHVGFFRISFDVDGADGADFEDPANFLVERMDDPSGTGGRVWTQDVTLPNVECDNCTLRLIQDMGADDYYQCADLVLRAASASDAGSIDDAGAGATEGGPSPDGGGPPLADAGVPAAEGADAGSPLPADAGVAAHDAGAGGLASVVDGGSEADGGPSCAGCASTGAPSSAALWSALALVALRRRRRAEGAKSPSAKI